MIINGTSSIVGVLSLTAQCPQLRAPETICVRAGQSFFVHQYIWQNQASINDALSRGWITVTYDEDAYARYFIGDGSQLTNIVQTAAVRVGFAQGSLVSHVLTIQHNLNQLHLGSVVVWDNANKMILPDEIAVVDANRVDITFTTYEPLTGTWYAVVSM